MSVTSTLCPHCEADYLHRAMLLDTGEQFLTCPECDATWGAEQALTIPNFRFWDDFMRERGLDPVTAPTSD